MIFILHYILLNVGLPAIIILITLFLHTHSDASLSEIGALLMALPFVSIVTKPLFCALADRQQAHKQYLMASLGFMALGYGSLTIAPFFPDFIKQHGRLVWYFDIVGIIVGFGAFGIVWSLGDALAVNGAQMAGVSWGSYRLWAVISWGVFGAIIGQINELPYLPAYVAGLLMLVVSLLVEIILLAVWPNERFVMFGHLGYKNKVTCKHLEDATQADQTIAFEDDRYWPARSHTGTLNSPSLGGTLTSQPKVLGAIANILMEDVGDSLKSTLNLGGSGAATRSKRTRKGLGEILGDELAVATANKLQRATSNEDKSLQGEEVPTAPPLTDLVVDADGKQVVAPILVDKATLDSTLDSPVKPARSSEDIQLILLQLIVRRDKTIGKYLLLFTLFGLLMMCHISYFYMNVRQLCAERGESFALISGAMMLAHAISEVTSFLMVPRYIPWAGRVGALMTCAALYLIRFVYYGIWLPELSTYYAIPFEFCHGLSYGIIYSLICDIAVECVDQVDDFLPELIQRGLVQPTIQPSELKSPLRATMQGVFSGAFDGLGNGLGALFGGVFLDSNPFARLWQVCAGVSLAILVIYPLTEWQTWRPGCSNKPLEAATTTPHSSKQSHKIGVK